MATTTTTKIEMIGPHAEGGWQWTVSDEDGTIIVDGICATYEDAVTAASDYEW